MANKLCPKCQTPAPIEAVFCGSCGHQYRTHFTPQAPTPNFAPPTPRPASSKGLTVALASVIGMGVFGGVLWLGTRPKSVELPHVSTVSTPPSTVTRTQKEIPVETPKQTSLDPVEAEARRAIERAKRNIDIPLANNTPKDSQGRIHLRGGGSINQEDWDAARNAVQNSPVMK